MKILVLFAHPALEKSRINRRMIAALSGIENVKVHDLYEQYPDLNIDVSREQKLLLDHDIIVFQHPLYWYSTPSILKEWQDLVLEYGFAYGSEGEALKGKYFFNALTAGGGEDDYQSGGYNHFTIRQLLAPMEQTANLCQMRYLPPYVVYSTLKIEVPSGTDAVAERYRKLMLWLQSENVDFKKIAEQTTIDEHL